MFVGLYLVAIVAANLSSTLFGPSASIINAALLIGLDLTARDKLHDQWHGSHLALRMTALIATGSGLSWIINKDAGPIAVASLAAFGLAAIADAFTYTALGQRARLLRVNGSNLVSAAVDSAIFPTIAFGSIMPAIVIGQFAAKVGGGFVWSLILRR